MNKTIRSLLLLLITLAPALSTSAQSPVGEITATLNRFFGNASFTAVADLQIIDQQKRQSTLPVSIAWLDGKARAEVDLAKVQANDLPPSTKIYLDALKKVGLTRISGIFRPDTSLAYLISDGLKAYSESKVDPATTGSAAAPRYVTEKVGNETIAGHPCVKNKVTVTNREGNKQEMWVWNATELKNFPVRMQMEANGGQVTVNFRDIKLVRPEARVFDAPAGYDKKNNPQELVTAALLKIGQTPQ